MSPPSMIECASDLSLQPSVRRLHDNKWQRSWACKSCNSAKQCQLRLRLECFDKTTMTLS